MPAAPAEENLCAFLAQAAPGATVFSMDQNGYTDCVRGPIPFASNRAYWIYFPEQTTLSYDGQAVAGDQQITLHKGWNLVGTRAMQLVGWDDGVLVDGQALTASGRITRSLLAFRPMTQEFAPAALMNPWQGYLVYAREDSTLRLPGQTGAAFVSGRVEDETGAPVSGALLRVLGDGRQATTDAHGQFALSVNQVLEGGTPVRVAVSKGGYIETFHTVRVYEDSVVNGVQEATLRLPHLPGAPQIDAHATDASGSCRDGRGRFRRVEGKI